MKLINNTVFKVTIVVVSFCFPILATAQYSQTIKGSVRDQASQTTLPGVNIILLSTNPVLGAVTDSNGEFKIKNVPVGRYDIQMSFIGYETTVISSVLVTSGKEVIINAAIKEMVALFDEVTVRSRSKNKALNTMTTLSARTFTVEETSRYAGGLDDPGRLVSVFAGVSDGNLQSNGIVVRGNAPFGTGYRIEGLSVDNPNHFAGEDFLGGGFVSILSKQILTNSDFLTGAFPAEYGNALSSVFDMNLKTGNTESYEHTFQAGIMGIDFASEGPLAKNKNASYL
ncbi:MAG TPA: carboxypeptidase-like regulatory domain-containing protein, partial [Prolixibacteraceae bacterium]|nr:carboxypeptidase-like regulatory domain-containing protein [Prolixibacteraceae bacterium]